MQKFLTKRIAISGRKGGTGKTTIACTLGSTYSYFGKKTLVVDLDPQSNVAFALGVDPSALGTAELLLNKNIMPQKVSDNLYVYPGGPNLDSSKISNMHPEELFEVLNQAEFDVIIFDCPPGNERLERLGISASNKALIVLDAHPFAVLGASRVIESLEENLKRKRLGPSSWAMVLSRIDLRRSADKILGERMKEIYPSIHQLCVHQDVNLSIATSDRTPLMDIAPDCRGAKDIEQIMRWCDV